MSEQELQDYRDNQQPQQPAPNPEPDPQAADTLSWPYGWR